MPELALGLPAAGAVLVAALRRWRPAALGLGFLLGAAGIAVLLPLPPAVEASPLGLTLSPSGRVFLGATAATLAVAVTLAPATVDRVALLGYGLAGVAALAAIVAAPDVVAITIVVALLAAGHAAVPGRRTFAARMRGPVFAVILLGSGAFLAADGVTLHARLAALAFVLGVVAAAGLIPFLPELDPTEPVAASPATWTGFFGPALAWAALARVTPLLHPDAVAVYGSLLVGIGLLNLFWGLLGAWLVENEVAAWRYSFLADWGLALVGLGIVVADARAAAFLVLLSVVLVRLPLYLWARPVLLGRTRPAREPANLLLSAALAGAAPFAGFVARLLLLRGAIEVFWPLAIVLGIAMLLWLGHAPRLAQQIGRPTGRGAVGVVLALTVSVLLGVLPGVALVAGGLQ